MKILEQFFFVRLICFILLLGLYNAVVSCKKFVVLDPPVTEIPGSTIFESDETALGVLSGIYAQLMKAGLPFGNGGITFCGGLSADELDNYSFASANIEIAKNEISPANSTIKSIWADIYYTIYTCNTILESVPGNEKLSEKVKNDLIGEAFFIRSFCFFYLVNLWKDVPVPTTSDYRINQVLPRVEVSSVYQRIIFDLNESLIYLSEDYQYEERVRPNRLTAKALLARVHLYNANWAEAEKYSSEIIGSSGIYVLEDDLSLVFRLKSRETIFQFMPVRPGYNTNEASAFILSGTPKLVALRPQHFMSFDSSDKRKLNWIGRISDQNVEYFFPFKYKVDQSDIPEEYYVVLRLGEQYLIRAEARLMLNNLNGAVDDINMIKIRAGLKPISNTVTTNECLKEIYEERKRELFAEWGHRWFDLRRSGQINTVLGAIKPGWTETDQYYPIPQNEILLNPNLTQNPGY